MEKKLTKRDMFKMLGEIVQDNPMLTEFIEKEIKLLEKKANSHTPTKTQKENEELKNAIVEVLKVLDRPATIAEIQNENPLLAEKSNQKMSALLKQLVDSQVVKRVSDKKKTLFQIA